MMEKGVLNFDEIIQKNKYIVGKHIQRVEDIAVSFGKYLKIDSLMLGNLALLSELHDVGKIDIPEVILLKPGPLSEEEWGIVKRHAETGYRIALSFEETVLIAEGILAHHERWDGRGYPQGLRGEDIPIISRIISIVDAYEAMTTDRPYSKAVSHEAALKELKMCSSTQFDPFLVQSFTDFWLD